MKNIRKRAAFLVAILLLLQSTVGGYCGIGYTTSYAEDKDENNSYSYGIVRRESAEPITNEYYDDSANIYDDNVNPGSVLSEEELKEALNGTAEICLSSDIILSEALVINDGKTHTIDLNGYEIARDDLNEIKEDGNVIRIENNSDLTINDSSDDGTGIITGGKAIKGGGIFVNGNLTVNDIEICYNNANEGAGVYVEAGEAEFRDVSIYCNGADRYEGNPGYGGGVMVCKDAIAQFNDCDIISNYSDDGAGILNRGIIRVNDCKIKGNSMYSYGGGIGIHSRGDARIVNCDISQNYGGVNGGGITNHKDMVIQDCTICGNSVTENGGGIYIDASEGSTTFEGENKIEGNYAQNGAGIYIVDSLDIDFKNMSISKNSANNNAAGIYTGTTKNITFKNVVFENNYSKKNGGAVMGDNNLSFTDCYFNGNYANNNGGAICYENSYNSGKLSLTSTTITGNICCEGNGGGVYVADEGVNKKVILNGGKIIISGNSKNSNGLSEDDNLMFYNLRPIRIQEKLEKGSIIGVKHNMNFDTKEITKDFFDHNDKSDIEFFSPDNKNYRLLKDENNQEVIFKKKLVPSANGYKVRVQIRVVNDADGWDHAYMGIYGKSNRGLGREDLLYMSPDIKHYVDDEDDVYEYEMNTGDTFPSKIYVQANFGGGIMSRDWGGDVNIWVNGVKVKNHYIYIDTWGNSWENGLAEHYINIPADKYPYPFESEVEMDRQIDLVKDSTKTINVVAVDQYGVEWSCNGEDSYKIENLSFPDKDTAECTNGKGTKWVLDSTITDNSHISNYKLKYKTGNKNNPWYDIDISVYFKSYIKLFVVTGNNDYGYTEVAEYKGHEGDEVILEVPETPAGYYFYAARKDTSTSSLEPNEDGTYTFKFATNHTKVTFQTKPIKYKLVYEKNATNKEVYGKTTKKTCYYDKSYVLITPAYRPNNDFPYEFDCWNTEPDGSGKSYKAEEVVKNLTTVADDVITLYAQWKPKSDDADSPSETASIFSDGKAAIWGGFLLMIIIGISMGAYLSVRRRS
ncbi:MAG: right-handed parallel beta-helix repeat-containing protein [Lachnospiraceae bacterium]|nr:right-handed parallel beta-helix repeat-containing protein [Lachnospiraceae bacterium]